MRTSLPSCIRLSEVVGDNFELKLQFINTLPKYHGLESEYAYLFIREFEEVCLMMRIPRLGDVSLGYVSSPLLLKNLAKK